MITIFNQITRRWQGRKQPASRALFAYILLFFSYTGYAQTFNISGHIQNEKGEPLPLVSIAIKGTDRVSVTDTKGNFIANKVDAGAVFIITSIGYQTLEYALQRKTGPLTIVLQTDHAELAAVELVSSGYQDLPKERATGSFVKIDNALLNQQVGTNILQRLDGVTSGLQFAVGKQNSNPQNRTNISIRGLATINGPLDPLIVLDGFIYEGDINNINPNDVDNVTVLKDAAASSIWGARAGNGVIIITSKKGRFDQKLQVGININTIVSDKPNLHALPVMSSAEYIDVEQMLFNNGYFDAQINGSALLALTPAVEVFLKRRNGLLSAEDSARQVDAMKRVDSRDEYLRHFYRNAVTQQYAMNVRGGSSNVNYILSMGYDKLLDEGYGRSRKVNIKMENNYQPIKGLLLNMGVYYTNSTSKSGRGLSYNSLNVNGRQVPYLKFDDAAGNPVSFSGALSRQYTDTIGGGKLLNWKYYPLVDYQYSGTTSNSNELYATGGLEYKLLKFMSLDLRYQFQEQREESVQLSKPESYQARGLINLFTEIDPVSGAVKYNIPLGGIRATNTAMVASHTGRAQLNIHHEKGRHSIYAIAGGEIRQSATSGNSATMYGYNADPLSYGSVDYVNAYPLFISGAYDYIPGAPGISPEQTNRFVSLYGNAAYTFDNRYTFSASARRDGSNIFGLGTNDKWKPLWSVGSAWKISREGFYHFAWVPAMSLRITYGHSGNVDLGRSALAVARYISNSNLTGFPSTLITTINNPDLRWEQVGIFNAGLDFTVKGNVLDGSLEYYQKRGSDLYGLTPYDYTTWGGVRNITKNVAAMKGEGIDLVLNSRNINGRVKWNTSVLYNYNIAKTTKYDIASAARISSILAGGTNISPVVGKPLYAVAAYRWGGLDNMGQPQGYVNGQLSTDYTAIATEGTTKGIDGNIIYIGPANPTVSGAVMNTIVWGNLSFSANIVYRMGYYFKRPFFSGTALIAGIVQTGYDTRWQQPGDEAFTNTPAFVYPANEAGDNFYRQAAINVLKGDHIRLQYINLGYTLARTGNRNFPFKDLQVYLNAANLGILWRANKEHFDPDYPGIPAPVKSIALGMRANF
ncbi:MAG: SusC/RagA family TonB-linked outer membrane protein [Ferruginibacter sp.]|nr:SusC/RagA family TonB-linked outer membrane protein [Ferruginibacter sp.]